MNIDSLIKRLHQLNFRQAVWFFPVAYALHVLEELPHFTDWARNYASPSFTMRDYLLIHLSGLVLAILAPLVLGVFRKRVVVFIFFTFIFTPAVCFNIAFHAAATAAFGVYCPGLVTAMTVYPFVFYLVTRKAFREHLLSHRLASISFLLAGLFHLADVSHNVFKLW